MWCRAAVPCKHSLTKALGTPHKPRVKSPCGKVCLGMVLGTTGGNPIYTEMNCQPPLHFHEEGFPTVFTLVKKSDTCENLHFLHVQIVIDQCVNTFSALWQCNVYKNTLSKIVSCIPQAIFFSFFSFFFSFFLSRVTCAGWKAQKPACRSTISPFLQSDIWEEWNWDTGEEHCFVCANSSAQEHCSEEHIWTVSIFSTTWARPKKSCLSFCPFSAPQLWTLFTCNGRTQNHPAPLARLVWGKAFYRMCLYKLLPSWNCLIKVRRCIHSLQACFFINAEEFLHQSARFYGCYGLVRLHWYVLINFAVNK